MKRKCPYPQNMKKIDKVRAFCLFNALFVTKILYKYKYIKKRILNEIIFIMTSN